MNIVIPFRNTSGEAELKMCLDLAFSNYQVPFENIVVIGDQVEAYNMRVKNVVVEERIYNKWLDNSFLVKKYIEEVAPGKPFILFNDDFFVTDVVKDCRTNYFSGGLKTRMEKTFVIDKRAGRVRLSEYGLNIKACIAAEGDIINGELHLPLMVKYPDLMLKVIDRCNKGNYPAMKRSVYLAEVGEEFIDEVASDVKFGEPHLTFQRPYFSLTDDQFRFFESELAASINRIHELETKK